MRRYAIALALASAHWQPGPSVYEGARLIIAVDFKIRPVVARI